MPFAVRSNGYQYNQAPKKFYQRRSFIVATIVVVALVISLAAWYMLRPDAPTPAPATAPDQPLATAGQTTKPSRVRIIATGDVIPHDALNAAAKQNGDYDYYQFMDKLQPYFDAADVRFCNQAVLGAGEKYGITGYPIFNSPTQVARDMQKIGCNVVNTGSNHTYDSTQDVINASVAAWDGLPDMLAVAGANRSEAEKQKIRYFERGGVRFAFLSYTTYSNTPPKNSYGVTMFSENLAKQQLREARKNADVVMVSMRWGTEYSPAINAQQSAQAQFLANNGADAVLGHGPHVLEPVKKLTGQDGRVTYVWFSLGNFLNAQVEVTGRVNGLAVMDVDPDSKQITNIGYLPTYMHYEWTAAQKAREDLMARRGFEMYLLEDAADALKNSQLNTTVSAQQNYVKQVLNKYTNVPILSGQQYLGN